MNELARQKYLNALGIDGYMPRVVLPHAPAPIPCAMPEYVEPAPADTLVQPTAPSSAPQARTTPTASAEPVGKVLADMGVSSDRKPLQTPLRQAASGVKTLHLHLWRPNANLLVLDEHEPGSALPKEALLTNILRVMQRINRPIEAAERIRCPINDDLAKLYSQSDLEEELKAWLNEELIKTTDSELWIFGLRPAKYLSTEASTPKAAFTHFQVACYGETTQERDALALPSLTELLHNPELKRQLWRALQARVSQ
ncbi:hypothetical protein QWI17_21485 [Gilvimarinus sp. SDUM040013]|uniref:Uncharacterized protein n=1 Tax=Gilvimarinus gilvus TaxID=3058038 RepID=A0ABU4RTI9_9GAMM|nr:hypothetical protein [Gilvimarinus sp. SDUM040013]MDO3388434.1 hypothetical protein [Gilvimarinus sp. SDUM040013]MDX6847984.1 hypothetical protein [Gilvimarinus sp. SDUM040013]